MIIKYNKLMFSARRSFCFPDKSKLQRKVVKGFFRESPQHFKLWLMNDRYSEGSGL